MATIHDVAKAAGVSAKTVSRVLNGDAPVNVNTRARIEAAMAELGYVPSSAARMMRSNRSGIVGVITGAISAAHDDGKPAGLPDLPILQGIQRVISAAGKTLMISDTGGQAEAVPGLVRTFQQHRVEGLIYVAEHHREVSLPLLSAGPRLVLANCFDAAGTPAILPDDRAGKRALVAEIVRAGHRRIAYLSLPESLIATRLRTAGYRDALEAAGLPFDDALVQPGEFEGERDAGTLKRAIDRMLALPEPPTVLCCGNDKLAMQAYGILRSRGVDVPAGMSVAGYDNYRMIAEALYPPLTTAELPYHAIGEAAARRLLDLIQAPDSAPETPQLVSGRVFWRDSVLPTEFKTDDFNPKGGEIR